MERKLILFELNEVPFRVIDEFCRTRPSSALARFLPRCSQYETYTEDVGSLSPWITWPTLHRGVNNERHGIHDFGQELGEIDQRFPPVWALLARRGLSVGVFGNLHTYPPPPGFERDYAFYVPDTFAAGPESHPAALQPFQEFNLAMARASMRNVDRRVPLGAALGVLARSAQLGLGPRTFAEVGRQLFAERKEPWKRTRRRTFQTVLGFDVFLKQLQVHQPAFATFFTNHVASAMHRYWAAAFPGDYRETGLDDSWVATYRGEIDYAMDWSDRFLGRLTAFVDRHPEYRLVVASSMGQSATRARRIATQLYIVELARFMAALGVPEGAWSMRPAMAPDWSVVVDPEHAETFATALSGLRFEGEEVVHRRDAGGFFHIHLGQPNSDTPFVELAGGRRTLLELGLSHVEVEDEVGSTAYHVPEGSLLVYPGEGGTQRARVSTCEIAPAILSYFGVAPPEYMEKSALLAA